MSGRDTVITVRAPGATRIDLEIVPGDRFELLVPLLDADDLPVEITQDGAGLWSARSQIRRHWTSSTALHQWTTGGATPNAFIVAGSPGQVRLTATAEETAVWQTGWPELRANWDLEVTQPGDQAQTVASGRIELRPQYTR